jgi:hypothetical protein
MYAHSNRLTLKFKAEQASCRHPRGHHEKKRLDKKFQQKLLPSTLCSLKFASCEKHMKGWKKKKRCVILEVASWQSADFN